MKNGKRLTRREKQVLKFANLNPENWLVFKKDPDKLHIVHRETGTIKKVSTLEGK